MARVAPLRKDGLIYGTASSHSRPRGILIKPSGLSGYVWQMTGTNDESCVRSSSTSSCHSPVKFHGCGAAVASAGMPEVVWDRNLASLCRLRARCLTEAPNSRPEPCAGRCCMRKHGWGRAGSVVFLGQKRIVDESLKRVCGGRASFGLDGTSSAANCSAIGWRSAAGSYLTISNRTD